MNGQSINTLAMNMPNEQSPHQVYIIFSGTIVNDDFQLLWVLFSSNTHLALRFGKYRESFTSIEEVMPTVPREIVVFGRVRIITTEALHHYTRPTEFTGRQFSYQKSH